MGDPAQLLLWMRPDFICSPESGGFMPPTRAALLQRNRCAAFQAGCVWDHASRSQREAEDTGDRGWQRVAETAHQMCLAVVGGAIATNWVSRVQLCAVADLECKATLYTLVVLFLKGLACSITVSCVSSIHRIFHIEYLQYETGSHLQFVRCVNLHVFLLASPKISLIQVVFSVTGTGIWNSYLACHISRNVTDTDQNAHNT